jgi:hypothetical protein
VNGLCHLADQNKFFKSNKLIYYIVGHTNYKHMLLKKTLSILFAFGTLLVACDKSDDPFLIDASARVEGEWQVTTVKTTIQNKGASSQVNDLDLSEEKVFFIFNGDGTYSTNAKINLTSITKADKTSEGTYKYANENLELDYLLEDFNLRAKFNFKMNELQSNKMSISLDERSLLDAFNSSIGQLSGANQLLARLVIDNIVDFEALINLKK